MSTEVTTMERLTDILGGIRVLHRSLQDEFDLHAMVKQGLPVESLMNMVEEAYVTDMEADVIVKTRTLRRRRASAAPLTPSESERMARIARLYAQAETVFGNSEKAKVWMHRPNRALQNELPLDMATTDAGARLVETVLERIAWGDYS
jgi:putative toxin-antitoxin system antitoxin component (TIGR02293 family)